MQGERGDAEMRATWLPSCLFIDNATIIFTPVLYLPVSLSWFLNMKPNIPSIIMIGPVTPWPSRLVKLIRKVYVTP